MTLEQLSAAFTRLEGWPSALRETGLINVEPLASDIATIMEAYRTGQLVAVADGAIERLLWHVEQCLGPINRETCEVVGDDDYSILQHNFKCVLTAKGTGGE